LPQTQESGLASLGQSKTLLVNSFQANNPAGFGLSQRDLDFDHYQDLESNYENRPSLWISPAGKWGEGRVELIQIPTDKEIYDNIVAFLSLLYSLRRENPVLRLPVGLALRNRHPATSGRKGGRHQVRKDQGGGARKFVIDFAGAQLDSLPADKPVEGVVTVGSGAKFLEQQVYKNRFTGGWRLVFQVLPDDAYSATKTAQKQRTL